MAVAVPAAPSATIRDRILAAREHGAPVRITGAGTWLDAGRPVSAREHIEVGGHAGIVEYVPGDLTLTALAGTPLDEIVRVTGAERQWLPLDPFGAPGGTLGATVATGSYGPLALGFGTPRDQVLGLEVVTGNGDVVRAGGRVVKNVAGFDLTRLFTGAWGTLGVLTEVTVRLRALPAAEAHLAVALPDDGDASLAAFVRSAASVRAEPYAMELVNRALAERLGLRPSAALLVRLGGNAVSLAAQRQAIGSLGQASEMPSTVWESLRSVEPAGSAAVRVSSLPSELATSWRTVTAAAPDALVHATVGRGSVRAIVEDPATWPAAAIRTLAAAAPGFVAERLPAALWAEADRARATRVMPDDVAAAERVRHALLRRVKDTYDPMRLLNPGILGEGIA